MMQKHVISFRNAIEGLIWVIKTQRNFKIHLFLSTLSVAGGLYFKISYQEFLTIFILITIGLVIEIINTTIEETIDALDKNQREEIKIAKDVSAAAVLVFSIGAFFIACVIFVPKILEFLTNSPSQTWFHF